MEWKVFKDEYSDELAKIKSYREQANVMLNLSTHNRKMSEIHRNNANALVDKIEKEVFVVGMQLEILDSYSGKKSLVLIGDYLEGGYDVSYGGGEQEVELSQIVRFRNIIERLENRD